MTVDHGQERSDASGSAGASDDANAAAPLEHPLEGVTVLMVDDSRTVRRSVAGYLESAGAEVVLAEDGFNALALLVEKRPDVLVADIAMPRLDGYQVCALVRANADFAAIPVLLLSSHDGLFDRARGSVAGASAHLSKPVERDTLISTVTSLLSVTTR